MVCIWASTLNATWGVMATCQIVKNMVFWASRVLRPQISAYISQIRLDPLPKLPVHDHPSLKTDVENVPAQVAPVQILRCSDNRDKGVSSSPAPFIDVSISENLVQRTTVSAASLSTSSVTGSPTQRTSNNKSSVLNPAAVGTSQRKILVPVSRIGARSSQVGAFAFSLSRYNFGVGPVTSPVDSIGKHGGYFTRTFPRRRIIVNLPKVNYEKTQESRTEQAARVAQSQVLDIVSPIKQNEEYVKGCMEPGDNEREETKHKTPEPEIQTRPLNCTEDMNNDGKGNESIEPAKAPQANRTSCLGEESYLKDSLDGDGDETAHSKECNNVGYMSQSYRYHVYQIEDPYSRRLEPSIWSDSESYSFDGDSSELSESEDDESDEPLSEGSEDESEEFPSQASSEYVPSEFEDDETNESVSECVEDESEKFSSYVPSESGDHETYGPLSESSESEGAKFATKGKDDHDNILQESDVNNIMSRAVQSLWGPEFVKLDAILEIIDKLTGESLLDATWRALGVRQDQAICPSSQVTPLTEMLQQLNDALGLDGTNVITREQIWAGERWEFIDQALELLQKSDVEKLKRLLSKALECWHSKENLKILSSELNKLSQEDRSRMERQALEMIQSSKLPDVNEEFF
jgi:hypothetical protein